jgi:plastocyanin
MVSSRALNSATIPSAVAFFDVPHNIVSTERKFKSPVLDADETFSHKFDAPGTYKYYCSIHPKMTGQVVAA